MFITVFLSTLLQLTLVHQLGRSYANKEAGQRIKQLAWQVRDALDKTMDSAGRDVAMLAELDELREAATPGAARSMLTSLQRSFPDYTWIGMTDMQGKVFAATDGLLEQHDVSMRPWFKEGLQGQMARDYHPAPLLGKLLPARPDPWHFVDVTVPVFIAIERSAACWVFI